MSRLVDVAGLDMVLLNTTNEAIHTKQKLLADFKKLREKEQDRERQAHYDRQISFHDEAIEQLMIFKNRLVKAME